MNLVDRAASVGRDQRAAVRAPEQAPRQEEVGRTGHRPLRAPVAGHPRPAAQRSQGKQRLLHRRRARALAPVAVPAAVGPLKRDQAIDEEWRSLAVDELEQELGPDGVSFHRRDHEGGKLWIVDADASMSLALKGDIVVFGKDGAVREVLGTLAGKRKPVTTANKPLVEWLRKESTGAALAFVAVAPEDLPLPPQIAGLQRFAVTVGARGITAVVDGDDAAISRLQAMSDQALAAGLAELETQHQAALAGAIPPAEGAMAIVGAAYAKSYAARFKPRRDGNRLSVSLEVSMGDPTMIVAGVGVLSAVAIPAFMDYMKKSRARARDAQQLPF